MSISNLQILKNLVKERNFNKAFDFVEKNDLLSEYIKLLTNQRDYKKAFKLIKNNNLNNYDYPKLLEIAERSHVRYICNQNNWVYFFN